MKILMLPSIFGGVSWWRFEVPAKALKALGIEVTCVTYEESEVISRQTGFAKWIDTEMPKYDLIHAGYTGQLEVAKGLYEARDRHKVPVIVDIDDDLDSVPTYNPGWKTFRAGAPGNRIAKVQLANADAITFSTPKLAKALSYLAKDKPFGVLENWVDIDSWDYATPKERQYDESIRLMLTGGIGRFGDWEIIKEPLTDLMNKYDGAGGKPMLRLAFLGATPDWVLPWMQSRSDAKANRCFYIQPSREVPLFNKMVRYVAPDIILSPTQTNTFNASKSPLKFYEAALAGAAFVCTDYDTYNVAPEGCCIKVDNTPTQWREAISALVEDPYMRNRLIDKAKGHVLDSCAIETYISQWVDLYSQVLGRSPTCQTSPQQPLGLGA